MSSRYYPVQLGRLLITCLLSLCSGILFSQTIFADLTATQFGDSILVNWTLKGGNTCVNMELQRSTDNIQFENIYTVGGTCGASGDLYYEYIDSEALKNSTVYYYRVSASGGFYLSDTTSILFVNAGDDQVFIYPNPSLSDFNITIDNQFIPPFLLQIYDAAGNQVNYSTMVFANSFLLKKGTLANGVYILKITTEDRLVLNKKIVVAQ